MKFVPFWVIPRRLSSNCRRFGTHCRFHLHRQVNSPAYEVLITCHTQYTSDSSVCIFYLIEQKSEFLLHVLQVFYMWHFVVLQTSTR